MRERATEAVHGEAEGLDLLAPQALLALLAAGQQEAAKAIDAAIPAIAAAADLAAAALSAGHKLVYVGAGSSGLVAMADALELPGTYGIPRQQIVPLLAGGLSSLTNLDGAPEDDVALARQDAAAIRAGDCVICVSASGSTPYVLAVAAIARHRGANIVAIANNPGAELLQHADVAVLLRTPPEVVAGSTRMGAGTAQKIAFNMLSTLAAVKLGHVHDGHMVNLRPENDKLKARAASMVAEIAGIATDEAVERLQQSGGSVKLAVLLAAGAADLGTAEVILGRSGQTLRKALADPQLADRSVKCAARR